MHYLYFVKMGGEKAQSAAQAIAKAQSILEKNSFTGSEGYWGCGGKCDWFVMGGAWSGEFSGLAVKGDFHGEVRKLLASKEKDGQGGGLASNAVEKHADDIQKLWLAMGGQNANPHARAKQIFGGRDDDAAVLTAELIAALKAKYPDDVEYYDSEAVKEKTVSSLSNEDVGHWLVVVDYHF